MTTLLAADTAAAYATWFSCLADPTRLRLLHAVATTPGEIPVADLAERTGLGQPNCTEHLTKLADGGFVRLRHDGPTTLARLDEAGCLGLPNATDLILGSHPGTPPDLPTDVTVRPMTAADWPAVQHIYGEGIATGNATFETQVPSTDTLDRKWLPGHRWIAELDGTVAGWAALTPVSARPCYAGVAETSIYVGTGHRGIGIGKALVHHQVTTADTGGVWTLQTAIFPENRASIALHRAHGFRTVGLRERIAQLGTTWRDTILLERRNPAS